ncbi:putative lysosome biogenesis protein [Pseudoscourfieldia marina]
MDWAEPTGLDWAYSSPIRSSPLSGVVPPTSNSPKKNTAQERAHVRRSQPHSAFAASVDSMLATTEHYVARLAHEPSVGLYYIQEHVHRSVRALERERETLKTSSENARDGAEVATQAREHLDEHLQTSIDNVESALGGILGSLLAARSVPSREEGAPRTPPDSA